VVNNPYIDLVKEHKQIMCNTEDIYKNQSRWDKYFHNSNDIVLEIWTGLGNFFSREVLKYSDKNFIWMEIKYKRLYISAEKALWNLNNYTDNWVRPKGVLRRKKTPPLTPPSKGGAKDNCSIPPLTRGRLGGGSNFVLLKDKWEHIVDIFW